MDFIRELKQYRHYLTKQQIKTLRGQAMSGETEAARKGLQTLLQKQNAKERHKLKMALTQQDKSQKK